MIRSLDSTTVARRQALIDELHRVPQKSEIVRGEIVRMSAASDFHARASGRIFLSLSGYEETHPEGRAYGDNAGFLCELPHRWSFSPDAAWYTGPIGGEEFLPEPPVFAAEIRSKDEYGDAAEREMADKRADYFAAGTQVVWDIDVFRSKTVRVFRASDPKNPDVFGRGETADAEPAVPGWSMLVDEVFR